MADIDYNDLVSALKENETTKVRKEINHDKGVLKETVLYIDPYTITIEYIDFGRSQTPLKFFAIKDGEDEPIYFNSIKMLIETLGIELNLKGYNEPMLNDQSKTKDDFIYNL